MNLTTTFRIPLGMGLALTLACGGRSSSSSAASTPTASLTMAYTNPTTGTIHLVGDKALSTGTHQVFDVVGTETGTLSAGLLMTLNVESTAAQWAKVQSGDPELVQNGAVYDLGTGVPILKAKVDGGTLTFVVGKKGFNASVPTHGVLARVALDLKAGANPGLVVFNAGLSGNKLLIDGGTLTDFTPGIGTLKVQ